MTLAPRHFPRCWNADPCYYNFLYCAHCNAASGAVIYGIASHQSKYDFSFSFVVVVVLQHYKKLEFAVGLQSFKFCLKVIFFSEHPQQLCQTWVGSSLELIFYSKTGFKPTEISFHIQQIHIRHNIMIICLITCWSPFC